MKFKNVIAKELKRRAELLEQEPIRIGEIARYVNDRLPENIKIMEINSPLTLNWLKDNQYAAILFDVNEPHRPVPVIFEFDENNNISQVKPYDNKAEERLKKWLQ